MEATGDNSIQFELTTLNQALMMLEQRTQDLRTAENVAMQSIPMIKTMQFSNMNLVRKINSAFIITLPVFKQALTQAIMLKRQRLQAEAMSALDAKTNEMLIRNAQNTAEQAKMTARLASGSSIKIETLEQTWRTIVSGIAQHYQPEELVGKQVLFIANLAPRQFKNGLVSEGMILSAENYDGALAVTSLLREVKPGSEVK